MNTQMYDSVRKTYNQIMTNLTTGIEFNDAIAFTNCTVHHSSVNLDAAQECEEVLAQLKEKQYYLWDALSLTVHTIFRDLVVITNEALAYQPTNEQCTIAKEERAAIYCALLKFYNCIDHFNVIIGFKI